MNTDLIMPFAVDVLAKSSAILVFTWLTLLVWRRASAAQRGCLGCIAFALIALLPFTRLIAPHWVIPFSKAIASVEPGSTVQPSVTMVIVRDESVSTAPTRTWIIPDGVTVGVGVWLAGIVLLMAYRGVGAFQLRRCRRASSPVGDDAGGHLAKSIAADLGITRPVEIRTSSACRVPVTWGTWRPVVMLPAGAVGWTPEWLECALRHELAHVKTYDHLKRLLVFLTCAFYWPNPLVWAAARQLQLAQEEASDNLVLQVGISPQDYAAQLVEVIQSIAGRGLLPMTGVAMARSTTLEGRISAILDGTRNRASVDRGLMMRGTGLALALGLALGAVQLRAEAPPVTASAVQVRAEGPAVTASASPSGVKPGMTIPEKLKSMVIDKIDFDHLDMTAVTEFLTHKTKELDPDHQGINFVLLSAEAPAPGTAATVAPATRRQVSITLSDYPLIEVLDLIARQANLNYSVRDSGVYFAPAPSPGSEKSTLSPGAANGTAQSQASAPHGSFHIQFLGYQQTNGAYFFQLRFRDLLGEQPVMKEIGDKIHYKGYTIAAFNPVIRDQIDPVTHVTKKVDESILELTNPDMDPKTIRLTFLKEIELPQ